MAHMKADHTPVEDVGRIAAEAGVKTLVLSTQAFAERFAKRGGGKIPSMSQAGSYSRTLAYLCVGKGCGTRSSASPGI